MITSILTLAYIGGLIGGTWIFAFRSKTFLHLQEPSAYGGEDDERARSQFGARGGEADGEMPAHFGLLVLGPHSFLASAGKVSTGLLWFGLSSWVWFALLFGAGFACSFVLSKQIHSLANYLLGLRGERLVRGNASLDAKGWL